MVIKTNRSRTSKKLVFRTIIIVLGFVLLGAGLISGIISLYIVNMSRDFNLNAMVNQVSLCYLQYPDLDMLKPLSSGDLRYRACIVLANTLQASYLQSIASFATAISGITIGVGAIFVTLFPYESISSVKQFRSKLIRKNHRSKKNVRYIS